MIRLLATLCVLPLAAPRALAPSGPEVGHFAPDHGLEKYPDGGKKVPRVPDIPDWAGKGRKLEFGKQGRVDLPDLRGDVVMLHAMRLEASSALSDTVLLIRDLLLSNDHRGLDAIAVTAGEAGEELTATTKSLGIEWPVALVSGEATTPYWDPEENGPSYLFLVGRSGQLVWRGDPLAEEKAFFEALEAALVQHDAPALGRDLRPELAAAQATYYEGEWDKARSLAGKVQKKYDGKEDADSLAIVEDARHLADLVLQHERDLLLRARDAMGKMRYVEFLDTQEAVEQGFKRTQLEKEVDEISKEAVKGMTGNMYKDAERWMGLRNDQPVLFPARKSSAGDRFAKELEKLVKSTVNSFSATQIAQRMLDQYVVAR